MDDSWADIFTDAEARTAEYSDTDSDDFDFTPRAEYDLDAVDESCNSASVHATFT